MTQNRADRTASPDPTPDNVIFPLITSSSWHTAASGVLMFSITWLAPGYAAFWAAVVLGTAHIIVALIQRLL